MVIIYAKIKIGLPPFINQNLITSQFTLSLRKLRARSYVHLCLPSTFRNRDFISVFLHYFVLYIYIYVVFAESSLKFFLVDGKL